MPFLALKASGGERVNFLWLSDPHGEGCTMAINTNLFKILLSPPKTCQLAWLGQTASSRTIEEALRSVGPDSKQSWGLGGKQTGERPSRSALWTWLPTAGVQSLQDAEVALSEGLES